MFRDIKDIKVKGGPFKEETVLENIISGPFNILYGTNGSGKTTISRHFIDDNVSLYGEKAYVFNDKFILDNISIRKEGVRAIAMLGSQAIEDEERRKVLRQTIEDCNAAVADANTVKDAKTARMDELKEVILAQLNNSKDGYLKRSLLSKGKQKVLSTNKLYEDGFYELLRKMQAINPDEFLQGDVRADVKRLTDLLAPMGEGRKNKLYWSWPDTNLSKMLERAEDLLRKTINKPLSSRDEMIIDMVCASEIRDRIVDTEAEVCPLCHQPIESDYRERLKVAIMDIFNEEARLFQNEIDEVIEQLKPAEFVTSSLNGNFAGLVKKLELQQALLADALDRIKNSLTEKKSHLYEPMDGEKNIKEILGAIDDVFNKISLEVINYNKSIDEFTDNRAAFEKHNLILAYFESRTEIDEYYAATEAIADADKTVIENNKKSKIAKDELQKLSDASGKDLYAAMKFINECLSMVFFDAMHLTLDVEGGNYIVKVRGNNVVPEDLSLGERNVLAMAYFFATIFAGKSDDEKYKDEVMVVIDDPISSFDDYNRVGMIVMMCSQVEKILCGNRESKVLVMSHDMNTISELYKSRYKTLTHVYRNWNEDEYYSRKNLPFYRLIDNRIKECSNLDKTDYSRMLERIWNFAKAECEEDVEGDMMVIGNVIRRVTEQYTLFNEGRDIEESFSDFSNRIEDTYTQNFFRYLPEKLFMNNDSHKANQNYEFALSFRDKRKLARAVIFYLLKKNKFHLKAQLGKQALNDIEARYYGGDSRYIFEE